MNYMWMMSQIFSKVLTVLFPSSCYLCKKEDGALCEKCLTNFTKSIDTPHTYILSIFCFRDRELKRVIHAIKYFHRKDLVSPLAKKLAEEMVVQQYRGVLVPIPMPTFRKYIRGYNQAEILAKHLSKENNLDIDSTILRRNHSSKRQVMTRTRGERLHNQKNTFQVIKNVQGMSIILVDDVTTTGATIEEARKVLLLHGALQVVAVTIAH